MRHLTQLKTIFTISLLFLFTYNLSAQNTDGCGTIFTPESEAYFQRILPQLERFEQEFYQKSQQRTSTALSSVPIKAHIIRTSVGTGGISAGDLNAAIANMNTYYANAYIEFFLCDGINYIDNSDFYDFETDEQNALTANNLAGTINIYFANSVTSSSSGSGLCGYAFFPGGPEVILMNNSCATNGSTLPHEMGHFFALQHTHGPSNSTLTTELVDGSNCSSTGDFICDTAADPKLSNSTVNTSCNYTGSLTDANGQAFAPDPLNIMSYSRKSCRILFSPQQYARIYATYQSSRNSMECPSYNVAFDADYTKDCNTTLAVNFTDNSFGATSWQWDVDGDDVIDYTTQNPSHIYTEGIYDVTLTISNGLTTLTKVYPELIEFGIVDISTTEINLTLITDDWPAETSWVFKDNSGTILYSGGPYIEGIDDFTTFNETFTVSSNECYSFTINDVFGDGICCTSGFGSYTLTTQDNTIIVTGSDYGAIEETFMANDVLGVDDYFMNNEVSVYPNPSTSLLHIKLTNTNNLPDTYKIYNMLGQLVNTSDINQLSNLSINIEAYSNGMYFIKIVKENNSISIPFIKN